MLPSAVGFLISSDVVALVNDPRVLTDDKIAAILRQYNTENLVSAASPSGNGEVCIATNSQYGSLLDAHPSSIHVRGTGSY